MNTTNNTTNALYIYGRKSRLYFLAGRFAVFLILFLLLWLSISLADTVFYFSGLTRWGLFFVNIAALFYLVHRLLKRPFLDFYRLRPDSDLSSVAEEIGREDPSIKDRLVNLYQLSREKPSVLLNAAVRQLTNNLSGKNYIEKLSFQDYLPGLKLVVPVLVSSLLLLSFMGDEILRSTLRLVNPSNPYARVPAFSFEVSPGNRDILYNQPLQINARYNGPALESASMLIFNDETQSAPRVIAMDKNDQAYSSHLKNVTSSFSYRISAKPQSLEIEDMLLSDTYHINVLIPPKIQELSVKITAPSYSKMGTQVNELNDGNITALKGSRVEIKFSSNKVLNSGQLLLNNGDTMAVETKGRVAAAGFIVQQNTSYKIHIKDNENLFNQSPILYDISVLPDNPPFVDISEPGQDIEAQLEDIIRLKVDAADDYGLTSVYLKYRYIKQHASDSSWYEMNMDEFIKGKSRAELFPLFDFSKFFVGYNDQIEYYAVAVDNNAVSGYASGQSAVYRVRFPSLDELFNEFSEREEQKINELEHVAEESEDLKERLEEINRELKRTEKMDWDLKKQIENSIEKQKNTQEKIEKIQKEIQEMVDKLDQNSLMNPEILEKYNELQNLFQDIATPELLDAMRKLQESVEKANPQEVEKALAEFKQNQQIFKESLERTLELFKQVQLEQQMDQLLQQAQKLAENQQKISEKLDNNDQSANVQNEQMQQKELLESLKRNLDKLIQEQQLQKFPESKRQLQEASSDIDQQKLAEQLKQLQEQLNSQSAGESARQSGKLQSSFQNIEQQLARARTNMQQQHKQNVQKKMLSAAKKMLQLSHEQENVQRKTQDASQLNDDLRQMAREQANLQNNLSKLMSDIIELSKETFFLKPEMNRDLANAATQMQKSMDNLSERRSSQAAREQQQAMESLNMSIRGMQSSMEQMAGAESGTGFEQFMEQLQQMAGAQGGLNGETLSFMEGQGNQGQLGMNQQAQRQRLAAQQKAIREALEQMNESMGNRSDILGRLDEMGDAMDEVIQDMLANNISRRTVERQRQILSRMLDAQKSVREREFSEKRKAEQAKRYLAIDPGEIHGSEDQLQKRLQEALKKALSEGYYSEYQELINAYFKELSSQKNKSAD